MNKPVAKDGLIPVREFAATRVNRRGYPITMAAIYMSIKRHKANPDKVNLDFEYVDRKDGIWIVDPNGKKENKPTENKETVVKATTKTPKESTKPPRKDGEDSVSYAGRVSTWKKSLNKK